MTTVKMTYRDAVRAALRDLQDRLGAAAVDLTPLARLRSRTGAVAQNCSEAGFLGIGLKARPGQHAHGVARFERNDKGPRRWKGQARPPRDGPAEK